MTGPKIGGRSGGPDLRSYRVDFSKLERVVPAFRARWNARLGAQELFEAFKGIRLSEEEFRGQKYIRLKQLQYLLARGYLDGTLRLKKKKESHD